MSPASAGERGSVTAELALALPAVVLVLLLGAGASGAASRQVALQDATADAARLLGRGEGEGTAARAISAAVPGAAMSSTTTGDLVCVSAQTDVAIGGFVRVGVQASSCALAGGL